MVASFLLVNLDWLVGLGTLSKQLARSWDAVVLDK
jgi:hypothetical protein